MTLLPHRLPAISVLMLALAGTAAWALLGAVTAVSAAAGDWPAYGGAAGGGQYSELTQIDKGNVAELRLAWRFRTGEHGDDSTAAQRLTFEAHPVVVDGKLIFPTVAGLVFALDAASGRPLWRADLKVNKSLRFSDAAARGVAVWLDPDAPSPTCRQRVFVATRDARLHALDGATGQACASFGAAGQVDLSDGVRLRNRDDYGVTSPPAVVDGVVVVGSSIGDNRAVEVELGVVRGFDARSGALRWRWDPVPRAADAPTFAEWQPAQAARVGAANAWAPLAVDSASGWVFVPTSSASPDFFGGQRLGSNRDANSVVALRADSGEVVWRRQLVHHDLWDYDLPAQPVLAELAVDGRPTPVLIQATKMGFVFVLDRHTGAPVLPIEERPVPASDVAGEQAWPTQPFPEAALQLARTAPITPDDAWGLTPLDRWHCRRKIAALRSEGIYTPPSVRGSLLFPGYGGGMNWGGVAFDPLRQRLIAPVLEVPMAVTLRPQPPGDARPDDARTAAHSEPGFTRMAGVPYALRRETLLSFLGAPCTAPPWGKLVAVDLAARKKLWERPIGTTAKHAPFAVELGMPFIGGAISTASGLVFMAGTTDQMLRAYDADDGRVLWETELPAGGQATPVTYLAGGEQYLVVAAGGHASLGTARGDEVVAYKLDRTPRR